MSESLRTQLNRWHDLSMKQINAASARALNRTATTVRAEAARAVKQAMPALKIGTIKDTMTVEKAKRGVSVWLQVATITVKRVAIPLIEFAARPKKVRSQRGPRIGVTASVFRGRELVPGAFIASTGTTTQVFKRKGATRFPIKKLWGPSVAAIVSTERVMRELIALSRKTFAQNFERELQFQRKRGQGAA